MAEACLHSSELKTAESANSKVKTPDHATTKTEEKKKLSDKTSSSGGSRKKAKLIALTKKIKG